jgi:GNAT superfamily N-acetyltransferase
MNEWFWRVKPELPEFQLLFVDQSAGEIVARGRTIPVMWDGLAAGLPAGIDGALEGGFRLREAGGKPNTLCALAAEVRPDRQGTGLSGEVIQAMRRLADRHGLSKGVLAPVRPSWKERYPLTPIDRYAAWLRPDGLPFDPWMRVHERLGGAVLKPEPHSLRITGTVAHWREWVGLEFPESGRYVFPRGLAPVEIDLAEDVGRYWEPNVWMHHP